MLRLRKRSRLVFHLGSILLPTDQPELAFSAYFSFLALRYSFTEYGLFPQLGNSPNALERRLDLWKPDSGGSTKKQVNNSFLHYFRTRFASSVLN